MDDTKLLELAAKACDGLVYVQDMGWIHEDAQGNRGNWWNPLADDGAALRLAVKLSILVVADDIGVSTQVAGVGFYDEKFKQDDDRYSATRRAIVRAAAEIGKNLG